VDRVPDPLLLRKSGSAGIRPRTSGSVTTEAVVSFNMHVIQPFQGCLVGFLLCAAVGCAA
jgi:hypothetical protein